MMKRKTYRKPTMKVVMLQHRTHLLEASPEQPQRGGRRQDYESQQW